MLKIEEIVTWFSRGENDPEFTNKLIEYVNKLEVDALMHKQKKLRSYAYTYSIIRENIQQNIGSVKTPTISAVVGALLMVYGWMRKTLFINKSFEKGNLLDFKKETDEKIQQIITYLPKIRSAQSFNTFNDISELREMLLLIKDVMNNSVVGTSKFLHFLNSEKFPIWDSKMAKTLYEFKNPNDVNNVEHYINYYDSFNHLARAYENDRSLKVAIINKFQLPKDTSFIRVVEFLIFCYTTDIDERS